MRASFVIVNYNRRDELLITIAKTKELIVDDRNYELIVVDNASVDGSAAAVEAAHPDVIVLKRAQNIGAPAWNDGFRIASGKYFIIIDDDSHIKSGLEAALDYLDHYEDIGVLALNVLTGPYTSKLWNWKDKQQIAGFIGCGAIFRKETYDKVGGYADWIFLYVNEWDLGLRVVDAGYRIEFFEACEVIHRASAINRTNKRLMMFVTKHEMAIVYKYFPARRWKYLLRIVINATKGIKTLSLKGIWWNILGMNEFLKIRKSLVYTPVSPKTQELFLQDFKGTRPNFSFIKRELSGLLVPGDKAAQPEETKAYP